jgi:hypothetical protein
MFDGMTPQQREEADRRRQVALERAQAIQTKKAKGCTDYRSQLDRFALDGR